MGFNSAFKGLKLLKKTGNGRLNNLNDPSRPQCVNSLSVRHAGTLKLMMKKCQKGLF